MHRAIAARFAPLLVALLGLVACATTTYPTSTALITPSPTPRQVTLADAKGCATTQAIAGPPGVDAAHFGGRVFGNGKLWVGALGPDGVIGVPRDMLKTDGSLGWKFGWWRVAAGDLTITGRRLDGPAPPVQADVPSGYGQTGFQATGVTFPTEGCWEITGHVGSTTLTFVTFVIKQPRGVPAVASCGARTWPRTVVSCDDAQHSISLGARGSGGAPLIWLSTLWGVDAAFAPGRQVSDPPRVLATRVWVFVYGANDGPARLLHAADATNPKARDGAFIYLQTWTELGSPAFPETLPAPDLSR